MPDDVPAQLTRKLSESQRANATEWWRSLASPEREAITVLARPSRRGLVCQLVDEPVVDPIARFGGCGGGGPTPDEPLRGTAPPALDEETDDLYEYLVNHELELFPTTTLHICTAETEARAAVQARRVLSTFVCPRGAAGCPMRRLIRAGGGRDVRIVFAPLQGGEHHG